MRLVIHKLRGAGKPVRFDLGNIFKRIDEDLRAGRLKLREIDWGETFRLAEKLSAEHTEKIGAASVDLWHVAAAIQLKADTFWTFDREQHALAKAVERFRNVPELSRR